MYVNTAMTEFSSESLKICVLSASPDKKGSTHFLVSELLKAFQNAEVSFFDAYKMNPKPCIDCGYCGRKRGCSLGDLDEFFEVFESCDVFVAAYPVYFLSLPAPMKAVLDRFQRYFSARFSRGVKKPVEKNRTAVLLSTCGSDDETGFEITFKQWKMAFSVSGVNEIETVFIPGLDGVNIKDTNYGVKVKKAVRKINNYFEKEK